MPGAATVSRAVGTGEGAFGCSGFGVDALGFLLRSDAVGDVDDDDANAKARGVGPLAEAENNLREEELMGGQDEERRDERHSIFALLRSAPLRSRAGH